MSCSTVRVHLWLIIVLVLIETSPEAAFALEAWSGQSSNSSIDVIFDGTVYRNAWEIESDRCPGKARDDPDSNAWRPVRTATQVEISQYGNPRSCDTVEKSTNTSPRTGFSPVVGYKKNDRVQFNGITYRASVAVPSTSFIPGQDSPWKRYTKFPVWSESSVYHHGDLVQLDGRIYMALFFTEGDRPSLSHNQNLTLGNGRPWFPIGQMTDDGGEERPPVWERDRRYERGDTVLYAAERYLALHDVVGVAPDRSSPWKSVMKWGNTRASVGKASAAWPDRFYAPHVDFALADIPDFSKLAETFSIRYFVLSSVVARSADSCLPTWGAIYPLAEFTRYRRIKTLRERGGDVMVSLGSPTETPLAAACNRSGELADVYASIVEQLNLNALDFNMQGTWLSDSHSVERRSRALKTLQDRLLKKGRKLKIWYSLPVLSDGLTSEGIAVIESAREHGVRLDGVNALAADFNSPECHAAGEYGNAQGNCIISALRQTQEQLATLFPEKSRKALHNMLGVTPMVGINNAHSEIFFPADARRLLEYAKKVEAGRLGIWSLERDKPGIVAENSAEHSGLAVGQASTYAFSRIFAPFSSQQGGDSGRAEEKTFLIANAGPDQAVASSINVGLDGSASISSSSGEISYSWLQQTGRVVSLVGSNTAKPSFVAPEGESSLTFTLTVSDGKTRARDNVNISVTDQQTLQVNLNRIYPAKAGKQLVITAFATGGDEFSYEWEVPQQISFKGQGQRSITLNAPETDHYRSWPVKVAVRRGGVHQATASSTLMVRGLNSHPPPIDKITQPKEVPP